MKWVVIVGVLVCWFVMPPLFGALFHKDAGNFQTGIKSAYKYSDEK